MYYCNEYGCQKRFCHDHRSTKCFARQGKRGPNPDVCVDCEDKVKSCNNKMLGFPLGIMCCCFCTFFMFPLLLAIVSPEQNEVCKLVDLQPDQIEDGWIIMTKAAYNKNKTKCDKAIESEEADLVVLYDGFINNGPNDSTTAITDMELTTISRMACMKQWMLIQKGE